jgi:pimeloyl-ACP methyl ester carboxylesterase
MSVEIFYVKYFSGFSLDNDQILFDSYLSKSDYNVAGFSYGAQQAFEYVYKSTERIDRLILLSPAFFQTQKSSFVRTQLRYFEANKALYIKQFLANVSYPSTFTLDSYVKVGTKEDLHYLLTYQWDKKKIQEVLDRGIEIEVFIGLEDKIVDVEALLSFFSPLCTTYIIKKYGHILEQ